MQSNKPSNLSELTGEIKGWQDVIAFVERDLAAKDAEIERLTQDCGGFARQLDQKTSEWASEQTKRIAAERERDSLREAEEKRADMFWPPKDDVEKMLYEIRNGKTPAYVRECADALAEQLAALKAGKEGKL